MTSQSAMWLRIIRLRLRIRMNRICMPTPVAQARSIVWLYSSSSEPILITYDMVQAKDKYKKSREMRKEKKRKTATERDTERKKATKQASELK